VYVTLELEEGGSNIENAEFPSLDARTVTSTSTIDKTMSQPFLYPKPSAGRNSRSSRRFGQLARHTGHPEGSAVSAHVLLNIAKLSGPWKNTSIQRDAPRFQLHGVCWLPLVHPAGSVLPEPLEPHA